jgi:hypothetical protein
MPSKSAKQQRFMGADLARARDGKKTRTGMSAAQLEDFAKKPKGKRKLPKRGSGELTPLGSRTLAGYQQKWGDGPGHDKFEAAVKSGILHRDRMFAHPEKAKV